MCFRVQHISFGRKRDGAPTTKYTKLPTPVFSDNQSWLKGEGGGKGAHVCVCCLISRGQCGMLKPYSVQKRARPHPADDTAAGK